MFKQFPLFPCAISLTLFLIGCGPTAPAGPKVFAVTGTLKVNGKPLPNVNVQFIPVDPQKPSAAGKTNASGHYSLINADGRAGSVAGSYKVVLKVAGGDASSAQAGDAYAKSQGGPDSGVPQAETPFPPDYSEASKTPKEVKVEEKANVIDIDI